MRSIRATVAGALLLAACSKLGPAGTAVAIEFDVPIPTAVEIGDTIQLHARVLDQNGDSVAATIRWRTPDSTVAVDSISGAFTGLQVGSGTGRVQPVFGSLVGPLTPFTVRARADTLIVSAAAESLFVPTIDSLSPPIVPKVAKSDGSPLSGRTVIITLVAPTGAGARLTGDVVADTLTTGNDGLPSPGISVRRATVASGDSVIVRVDARRRSGAVVPGSGQKIRIFFQ